MTDLSRRTLLGASAVGVAVAPFVASPADAAAASARLYTRRRFKPLRKKKFRLTNPSGSWTMRLTKVTNLQAATKGDNRCFALTFRSQAAGPPQGTYTLRRRGFTATTLFVVPRDDTHRDYEAIINNRKS